MAGGLSPGFIFRRFFETGFSGVAADVNQRIRQAFLTGAGAVAVYCVTAGDDELPPVMIGTATELEGMLSAFAAHNSEPVSIVHAAWLFDARTAERAIARLVDEWTNLGQWRRGFWFNVPPATAALVLTGIIKEFGAYSMTLEQISQRLSGIPQDITMMIHAMRQRGEMKRVNSSYKQYRLDAASRGDPVATWSSFLDEYRVELANSLGATWRRSEKF
jgi:hypothetical protein